MDKDVSDTGAPKVPGSLVIVPVLVFLKQILKPYNSVVKVGRPRPMAHNTVLPENAGMKRLVKRFLLKLEEYFLIHVRRSGGEDLIIGAHQAKNCGMDGLLGLLCELSSRRGMSSTFWLLNCSTGVRALPMINPVRQVGKGKISSSGLTFI